jgi:peptidoglycan/LPS O-acetylase OafA/YrhL
VIKALIDDGASTGFAALTLIAVPICLVVAIGSHAAIESPFLRLRRQWPARPPSRSLCLSRHA